MKIINILNGHSVVEQIIIDSSDTGDCMMAILRIVDMRRSRKIHKNNAEFQKEKVLFDEFGNTSFKAYDLNGEITEYKADVIHNPLRYHNDNCQLLKYDGSVL